LTPQVLRNREEEVSFRAKKRGKVAERAQEDARLNDFITGFL
jgi:hypothetical protein